jgi:predicted Zn-dependent peptidase
VRLLRCHAEHVDAASLERARQQIVVRELRALERPSRRLEAAALDLFALGRLRPRNETMAALAQVSAHQVRDAFATMLSAGATIAVAGKLRRGLDERVRELARPILPAGRDSIRH